ncbi:NADAR family protein [Vreelandella titanicae]|uniref:NADAR family protein n=1 Tax=Vreelandella titanicae TaxID=664683 RepID=A0A558J7Y7_9GAMM|nr:NADAR family protein [Halomonas titanicae]TVU89674.1 NADAR family protein [Halomonas titanicae]
MDNRSLSKDFRTYVRDNSAVFKKTSEKWGGFSNMAAGYPLCVNGIYIRSTEALYQSCRFPNDPEVQRKILSQSSPMTAKMVGKPHRTNTREDWERSRIVIMKWCLRVKLAQNYEKFSKLLKEAGDYPIVESSNKDDFWGAKPVDSHTLIGINALGRLLMELRWLVTNLSEAKLSVVPVPTIDNFLLYGEEIKEVYASDVNSYINSQDSLFNL